VEKTAAILKSYDVVSAVRFGTKDDVRAVAKALLQQVLG
jgi:hypothetical protein